MLAGRTYETVEWGSPINWAHPLNIGLRSWWLAAPNRLGWKSAVWRDMCRRNNAALTAMNPSADWQYARGRPGGSAALNFDGTNDYGALSVWTPAVFSISAWVYLTTTSGFPAAMSNLFAGGGGNGYLFTYFGGNWLMYGYDTAFRSASVSFSENVWTHVLGTCDGSTLRIYKNGVAGTPAACGAIDYTNADSHHIGRYGSSYFQGQLDDVREWSRPLSASEVVSVYKDSLQGYPGTLKRWRSPRYMDLAATGFVGRGLLHSNLLGQRSLIG